MPGWRGSWESVIGMLAFFDEARLTPDGTLGHMVVGWDAGRVVVWFVMA